jgi:hypothetical protein
MSQNTFLTIYLSTLAFVGGVSGFVISHLLNQINKLEERVDEIYNILLER